MEQLQKRKDLMKETEFHKKRVAFMVINGKISFLKNSEKSHFAWAKELGIAGEEFNQLIRGCYLHSGNQIVFYKGNFSYDERCIEAAKHFAKEIKEFCNAQTAEVWCGMEIGKIGETWKPQFYVQTI